MKILMVCLGNICRSPMADGILRKKLDEAGLEAMVDSAGTSDYHIGESPDKRAAYTVSQYDIDISSLSARQFSVEDYDEFDRIYVMDTSNYADVLSLARNEEDKNKVEMILNLTHPGSNKPVPDPYFGGDQGFENVYKLLDAACDKIVEDLKKQ